MFLPNFERRIYMRDKQRYVPKRACTPNPTLDGAFSVYNGIGFHSKKSKGYQSFASIDENGTIYAEWTSENMEMKNLKRLPLQALWMFSFLLILFVCTEWAASYSPFRGFQVFLLGISLVVFASLGVSLVIRRNTEPDLARFHGAEHKVVGYYRKHRKVPTVEAAKVESRFDNNCSHTYAGMLSTWCFIAFVATFCGSLARALIVLVLGILITLLLQQLGYMNFLQHWSTQEPTERELQVAIAALQWWLENEKETEVHPHSGPSQRS